MGVRLRHMSQARVLIVATVAATLLYIVGVAALGSTPEVTDSPAQVLAWLSDHQDGARLYVWTATFGTLALAVIAAIVSGLMPRPFSSVFLLGAAALIIETALQAWFWGALALHPGILQPATARVAVDIASFWGPVLTGATMTMIGAVTALGFRTPKGIPGWLTVLGAVVFVEQAIETITVFGTHGFIAPGGGMNLLLGAGLTVIWIVALAVWAAGQLSARASAVSDPAGVRPAPPR